MGAEKEKDEAKEETQIARLATVAAGDTRVRVEDDLDRVRDALAVAEEAKLKVEAEITNLEVERTSFYWSFWWQKMKCSHFSPKPVKTKKP